MYLSYLCCCRSKQFIHKMAEELDKRKVRLKRKIYVQEILQV